MDKSHVDESFLEIEDHSPSQKEYQDKHLYKNETIEVFRSSQRGILLRFGDQSGMVVVVLLFGVVVDVVCP